MTESEQLEASKCALEQALSRIPGDNPKRTTKGDSARFHIQQALIMIGKEHVDQTAAIMNLAMACDCLSHYYRP